MDIVPIITEIEITQGIDIPGERIIYVKWDDSENYSRLFTFYSDEIQFTIGELIGLTREEAMELRHKKDVAYLQS